MKIFRDIVEMQRWSMEQRISGATIGLVPTMGYLHKGHLSLIEEARVDCDLIIVSIFVNPTQFGPNEDYGKYPRDKEGDIEMCEKAGVAAVFIPDVDTMYSHDASVCVIENSLSQGLCGQSRPTHFGGVCTVVAKLFNIMQPNVAVFGQKDYQQVAVIRRMVQDLNFAVEIRVAPIVREHDGLAVSSRNMYLSNDERQQALSINSALNLAHESFFSGQDSAVEIKNLVIRQLHEHCMDVDYVEIINGFDLNPVETVQMGDVVVVAAFCGKTRLIDNCIL
ncbi:MAG: pantoate--beta-alanine ligase [Kiritimatiellae bacterium]|jgi:pantoate--beta-alanine ligase|nr:pantoate--beta-alanine ligase [Kiritimatiellia bacterium]